MSESDGMKDSKKTKPSKYIKGSCELMATEAVCTGSAQVCTRSFTYTCWAECVNCCVSLSATSLFLLFPFLFGPIITW